MNNDPAVYAQLTVLTEALTQLIVGMYAGQPEQCKSDMQQFAQRMSRTQIDTQGAMDGPEFKIAMADCIETFTQTFCDRVVQKVSL
jgi:hypothetical protein